MTYEFPPPVPMSISVSAFAAYVLFIAFALAATQGIFAWQDRLLDKSLLRRSLIALGVAAALGAAGLVHPQLRARLREYLGFFAITVGSVATVTLVRQLLKRPPSTIWALLAILVGIVIAATTSHLPPPFHGDSLRSASDCPGNLRLLQIAHLNAANSRNGQLPEQGDAHEGVSTASWRLTMLNYMEREFDKEGRGISTAR